MSNLPHADNVAKLRSDLRHFEECGDSGETVMDIKAHLLRRIAELDAALRQINSSESEASPVPPKTPDPR